MTTPTTIQAVQRPYLLTFHVSAFTYPVSSEEAQRLLDSYPAITATRSRVVLRGDGENNKGCTLRPATRGGGPAFIISK
jgi:hypothetical protein